MIGGDRLDWEAVMAYVLLPPAGGVLLLIMEHKSDYVRCVSCLGPWLWFVGCTDEIIDSMHGSRLCCLRSLS